MNLRIFFLLLVSLGAWTALSITPAEAQIAKFTPLKTFRDWKVYQAGTAPNQICFAMTRPRRSIPKNVNRGHIHLTITNRPESDTRHEVGIRIGYPFSAKSRPFAQIGKRNFQFFTFVKNGGEIATRAWLENINQQGALLRAMRRGVELTFKGTSARGTLTTDYFSLLGLSDALKEIDRLCK